MISIGIPFYNAEKFLAEAVKSVINQSFADWELILLDDGSTDHSKEIAIEFAKLDSRIRVISDGQNKKLPYRLNQLIDESKYQYIARMDADDIMHPLRLEKQLAYLTENPSIDLVSSSIFSIDTDNNIIGKREIINAVTIATLLKGNHQIAHPSVMAKKSWFKENRYDEKFDRAEDYELWLRSALSNKLNIFIFKEPLLYYREFGNLTKEKLVASYRASLGIMFHHKKKIELSDYLRGKLINYIKIFAVNILFLINNQDYLAKRRNVDVDLEKELIDAKSNLEKAIL